MTSAADAAPPDWFTAALATEPERARIDVEGTPIAYRAWGQSGGPGIVLVHGGAAHSRWWDHIAPLMTAGRRVAALDLSGHGDSGRRETYSLDMWAREVLAVAAAAGISVPPTVIRHSMGGFVTLRLASLYGSRIAGAVIIDSPIRDLTPEEQAAREHRAFGPLRVYPTRAAAIARFHPVPDQPTLGYITRHIAETSVREVEGGWTWKFDPRIFGRPQFGTALLTRLDCRVALFRAEHGIMSRQMSEVMYDQLGRVAPLIEIPVAGHHVMLDQPIALIAVLRTLLSDWDHSLPPAGPVIPPSSVPTLSSVPKPSSVLAVPSAPHPTGSLRPSSSLSTRGLFSPSGRSGARLRRLTRGRRPPPQPAFQEGVNAFLSVRAGEQPRTSPPSRLLRPRFAAGALRSGSSSFPPPPVARSAGSDHAGWSVPCRSPPPAPSRPGPGSRTGQVPS